MIISLGTGLSTFSTISPLGFLLKAGFQKIAGKLKLRTEYALVCPAYIRSYIK